MIKVIKNTYPSHPGVPHAEPGDLCEWKIYPGKIELVRISDKKGVFLISGIDTNGLLYSTKKPPKRIGIIAQVKKRNWILEVENE